MNDLQLAPSQGFMTPSNLTEAMQLANILAESSIVPKDYQRSPGNILVAMQWGAEIGLKPLQAMQNIAVINGRPSIWGDAMLALVRGSGLLESITEELSDDGQTATCTVKRKGEDEVVSKFTMDDAKKAGLSGKQGPWSQYPKRMLKLRARAYALRDVFPDVIKGMAIAEEEQDKPAEPKDVTPTPTKNGGTASIKDRIKAKKAEPVMEAQATECFDIEPKVKEIQSATTLDELMGLGKDIAQIKATENLCGDDLSILQNAWTEQRASIIYNELLNDINQSTADDAQEMRQRIYGAKDKLGDERVQELNEILEAVINQATE